MGTGDVYSKSLERQIVDNIGISIATGMPSKSEIIEAIHHAIYTAVKDSIKAGDMQVISVEEDKVDPTSAEYWTKFGEDDIPCTCGHSKADHRRLVTQCVHCSCHGYYPKKPIIPPRTTGKEERCANCGNWFPMYLDKDGKTFMEPHVCPLPWEGHG
jgi:hypothetical protein